MKYETETYNNTEFFVVYVLIAISFLWHDNESSTMKFYI